MFQNIFIRQFQTRNSSIILNATPAFRAWLAVNTEGYKVARCNRDGTKQIVLCQSAGLLRPIGALTADSQARIYG